MSRKPYTVARASHRIGWGPILALHVACSGWRAVAADAAPVTLSPVSVTADLDQAREEIAPNLGAVAYNIGSGQIATMGLGEDGSFQQILLQAPGVVQDEFGEEHVRGDHGDLQYRINGVLLPESLNGFGQEIDPHLIRSVTLMTGTLPAQFGFRTAGIIDVDTKSGAQVRGVEASVSGGAYDTLRTSIEAGGASGPLDSFITLSSLQDDVGIDNTTPREHPLHDITQQERAFGLFSWRCNSSSRVSLLVSGASGRFEIPDTGGAAPGYQLVGAGPADSSAINENQTEKNGYVVLSYQGLLGPFSFQVSAFSRGTTIRFTPDDEQDLLFAGVASAVTNADTANGIQADGAIVWHETHTLRTGFLANHDCESLDTAASAFPTWTAFAPDVFGEDLPPNTPQSVDVPMRIVSTSANRGWTAGAYVQDEWRLLRVLTLNYGVRADEFDVSFDHEGQISPRVNLVWQPDDTDSFHVGYARYFMPPTLQYLPPAAVARYEYTTNAPYSSRDDPQRCERDHYFDAGFSRQLTPAAQVTADAFCKLARELLDDGQFGSAVILNNFNYARGTVYGAEVSGSYKSGPLSGYGSLSYVQTWARQIDTAEFEFPANELAYLFSHQIQLDHQSRFAGSGGAAFSFAEQDRIYSDCLYSNGLRAGFANVDKLPAYWSLNVGWEHRLILPRRPMGLREIKFRLDCINLLNAVQEIRDGTGVGIAAPAYGPRRSLYGTLSVRF